jgi:hypothetical protein
VSEGCCHGLDDVLHHLGRVPPRVNSRPARSTMGRNSRCVGATHGGALRRRPMGMNGWMSPREPTAATTMDMGGTWVPRWAGRERPTSLVWAVSQRSVGEASARRGRSRSSGHTGPGRDGLTPRTAAARRR